MWSWYLKRLHPNFCASGLWRWSFMKCVENSVQIRFSRKLTPCFYTDFVKWLFLEWKVFFSPIGVLRITRFCPFSLFNAEVQKRKRIYDLSLHIISVEGKWIVLDLILKCSFSINHYTLWDAINIISIKKRTKLFYLLSFSADNNFRQRDKLKICTG